MKWLFNKFKRQSEETPEVPEVPEKKTTPITFIYPEYPVEFSEWLQNGRFLKTWNSIHPKEQYTPDSKKETVGFFSNNSLAPLPEALRRSGFVIERKQSVLPDEKYIYYLSTGSLSLRDTITNWGENLFDNINDQIVEDINTGKCLFIFADVDDRVSYINEGWLWSKLDTLLCLAGIEPSKLNFVTRNSGDKAVCEVFTTINVLTWDYYATAEKIMSDATESYCYSDEMNFTVVHDDAHYLHVRDSVVNNSFALRFRENMKRLGIDPTFDGKIEIVYGNVVGDGYPEDILEKSVNFPMKLLHCFSSKKPFIYISNDNLVQEMQELNYGSYFGWSVKYSEFKNETRRLNELNGLFIEIEKNKDKLENTIAENGQATLEGNYSTLTKSVPEREIIELISDFYGINYYENRILKS